MNHLIKIINEEIEKQFNLNDNFWKWFGNSIIKDSTGKPIVANHYSNSPNIQHFKMKGIMIMVRFFINFICFC